MRPPWAAGPGYRTSPEEEAGAQKKAKSEYAERNQPRHLSGHGGLIHNLNTMHSRAGAQVPFSSLNYGTDTSPEGRMVIRKSCWLATEAGLGNGETPPFSPIHIFKLKAGVNYNPGDPNYDLFELACRVLGQAAVPQFLFPGRTLQSAIL